MTDLTRLRALLTRNRELLARMEAAAIRQRQVFA